MNNAAGRPSVIAMGSPTSFSSTVVIQQLTISNFSDHAAPEYRIQAATDRHALEDILSAD
jgi:hypothetical protein